MRPARERRPRAALPGPCEASRCLRAPPLRSPPASSGGNRRKAEPLPPAATALQLLSQGRYLQHRRYTEIRTGFFLWVFPPPFVYGGFFCFFLFLRGAGRFFVPIRLRRRRPSAKITRALGRCLGFAKKQNRKEKRRGKRGAEAAAAGAANSPPAPGGAGLGPSGAERGRAPLGRARRRRAPRGAARSRRESGSRSGALTACFWNDFSYLQPLAHPAVPFLRCCSFHGQQPEQPERLGGVPPLPLPGGPVRTA